jgi:hypothetical protein
LVGNSPENFEIVSMDEAVGTAARIGGATEANYLCAVEHSPPAPYHPVLTMRFCRWYPLSDAARHAPSEPGVFQVRVVEGLVEYPRGKSAMIHYGAGPNVRAAVREFSAARRGESLLCRHTVEMSDIEAARPEVACQRLIEQFMRRFGSPPECPR